MSDSPSAYLAKLDAMFDTADQQLEQIGRVYVLNIAARLIATTPGPNLQFPEDTEYIATGRLRGGWHLSAAPLGSVDRYDDGPYTEHGDDTLALIEGELSAHMPTTVYLVNDVAYGYIVHHGLGRHTIKREWVSTMPHEAERLLQEARREVMGL